MIEQKREIEMVRPAEAARVLGVSPYTLSAWADRGLIRVVTLPTGHRRYFRQEIEALAKGGR